MWYGHPLKIFSILSPSVWEINLEKLWPQPPLHHPLQVMFAILQITKGSSCGTTLSFTWRSRWVDGGPRCVIDCSRSCYLLTVKGPLEFSWSLLRKQCVFLFSVRKWETRVIWPQNFSEYWIREPEERRELEMQGVNMGNQSLWFDQGKPWSYFRPVFFKGLEAKGMYIYKYFNYWMQSYRV